ncbi:MAG: DUF4386 domain-containing protein [Prolixibacteraceae bacterium]|jgi:hypothetical protein|nr:DUF4386 domain-containing protein [Prolixibacteraceae bacterium]MBT6005584.1 DUF4386 domain-containing protein [Prolixibacteraceae bacterium]MBT6766275.1 DUF4386 domain-containing protein [Prolixibacteraceae bacterium]MBT6998013.1 DUF4386 domain-containing protein [Prolixibacteraceae bacterium]MBT7394729.1 DUF4386 domain-containing protein [Prolixibacteraceae bacterium]
MSSNRKTAIFAGILIIFGMVAGLLSIVPSVESPDYLTEVAKNQNQVLSGAFFQFTLVPIYIGFALILYPIIQKYSKSLAIGFVSFRVIAGVFQIVGVIALPIFILLSQEYLESTPSDRLYFQTFGEVLKLGRDLANHVGVMLATGLGNLILFYILFKTKLIPRWLSSWGLIGNTLAMLASFLILFSLIEVISSHFIVLTIPLVLQEIVLAIWLIVKGFNLSVFDSNTDLE